MELFPLLLLWSTCPVLAHQLQGLPVPGPSSLMHNFRPSRAAPGPFLFGCSTVGHLSLMPLPTPDLSYHNTFQNGKKQTFWLFIKNFFLKTNSLITRTCPFHYSQSPKAQNLVRKPTSSPAAAEYTAGEWHLEQSLDTIVTEEKVYV